MNKEIDLSKYQIRTDLAVDEIDKESKLKGVKVKEEIINDIKVTTVKVDNINDINRKPGNYITLEFDDITDIENKDKVIKTLTITLRKIIKFKKDSYGLIIGLGNDSSTPDSLGPLVVNDVIVTNHLFELGEMSTNFKRISAISPGVTGETGIETSEIIKSLVNEIKPDYIIAIDSLASKSISRLNKTIQITDTGISPGSGIGNKRKEISKDTLGIPVIAIGVPTVVDAAVIARDTIDFIYKNYAFNKEYMKDPRSKLSSSVNYLKKEIKENKKEKEELLGLVGSLNSEELQVLLYEVLNPIGYNLMVTPKEIDFVIEKLASVISTSLNYSLHNIDKII